MAGSAVTTMVLGSIVLDGARGPRLVLHPENWNCVLSPGGCWLNPCSVCELPWGQSKVIGVVRVWPSTTTWILVGTVTILVLTMVGCCANAVPNRVNTTKLASNVIRLVVVGLTIVVITFLPAWLFPRSISIEVST